MPTVTPIYTANNIYRRNCNFESREYQDRPCLIAFETEGVERDEVKDFYTYKADLTFYRCPVKRRKKPSWLRNESNLIDQKAIESPFVPMVLKTIVLNIEDFCAQEGNGDKWYEDLSFEKADRQLALSLLQKSFQIKQNEDNLEELLDNYPIKIYLCMLKIYLLNFPKRLFYINVEDLRKLCQHSLYDKIQRIKPHVKPFISNIVMRMTRTEMDTLSFMMIHVLHLFEHSKTPHITKTVICEFYGSLIIKLQEKPLVGSSTDLNTIEATILQGFIDSADTFFWNRFGSNRMLGVFRCLTPFEEKRLAKISGRSRISMVFRQDAISRFV